MAIIPSNEFFTGGKIRNISNEARDIGDGNKEASGGKNFFERFVDRAKETAGDIKDIGVGVKDAFVSGSAALGGSIDAFKKGEQSFGETVFQGLGQGAKAASESIGEVVVGAGKALLSQEREDQVKEKVQSVVQSPAVASKLASAMKFIDDFKQENPRAARNLAGIYGFLSLGTDVAGGGIGKQAIKTGTKTAATGLKTGSKVVARGANELTDISRAAVRGAKSIAPDGKKIADSAIAQSSGFNPATVRLIMDDPAAFKAAREAGLDRLTLANQLKDRVDDQISSLQELGAAYNPIRNGSGTVKIESSFLDDQLKQFGIVADNGKLKASTGSITRKQGDINAVQSVYDDWNPRLAEGTPLSADEYLNFRSDLSDLANYDKTFNITKQTKASETIGTKIREEGLNADRFRKQIDGLKELDAQFAPEKQELDILRKELFDKNGELKDSAVNSALADTTRGRRNLEQLQKLDPEIEPKLKMMRAIKDVEYAKGQKVGTYFRAGSSLAAGAVNPLLGVATFLLTQPEMMIKFLGWISKVEPKISTVLGSVTNKIKKGVKLTSKENGVVGSVLRGITKEKINRFTEAIGTGAGAGALPITEDVLTERDQQEPVL